MGLFEYPHMNHTIDVRTKDEMVDAMKENYGKIYLVGDLQEDMLKSVKGHKIMGGAAIASFFVSTFFPPALLLSLGGFSAAKYAKYKIYQDPTYGYYLRHDKLPKDK